LQIAGQLLVRAKITQGVVQPGIEPAQASACGDKGVDQQIAARDVDALMHTDQGPLLGVEALIEILGHHDLRMDQAECGRQAVIAARLVQPIPTAVQTAQATFDATLLRYRAQAHDQCADQPNQTGPQAEGFVCGP
jgi:hypothetical protein